MFVAFILSASSSLEFWKTQNTNHTTSMAIFAAYSWIFLQIFLSSNIAQSIHSKKRWRYYSSEIIFLPSFALFFLWFRLFWQRRNAQNALFFKKWFLIFQKIFFIIYKKSESLSWWFVSEQNINTPNLLFKKPGYHLCFYQLLSAQKNSSRAKRKPKMMCINHLFYAGSD